MISKSIKVYLRKEFFCMKEQQNYVNQPATCLQLAINSALCNCKQKNLHRVQGGSNILGSNMEEVYFSHSLSFPVERRLRIRVEGVGPASNPLLRHWSDGYDSRFHGHEGIPGSSNLNVKQLKVHFL